MKYILFSVLVFSLTAFADDRLDSRSMESFDGFYKVSGDLVPVEGLEAESDLLVDRWFSYHTLCEEIDQADPLVYDNGDTLTIVDMGTGVQGFIVQYQPPRNIDVWFEAWTIYLTENDEPYVFPNVNPVKSFQAFHKSNIFNSRLILDKALLRNLVHKYGGEKVKIMALDGCANSTNFTFY